MAKRKRSDTPNESDVSLDQHPAAPSTRTILTFMAGCLTTLLLRNLLESRQGCIISFGKYHGNEYRNEQETVGTTKCLLESKFVKVQQHHVKMPGASNVIPDWIWIDYHDRINVLVQSGEEEFLVFEQTKYALENRQSQAIVGGIIEPGELPEAAARREVSEELGLDCKVFTALGRYRTDVNRGVGWTSTFLATECNKAKSSKHESNSEEVGAADTERQDIKTISLSELREAVLAGRFLEIQWTATVALSLLHLSSSEPKQP
jgi:ADP-ribose pyrophosphatase